MTPHTARLMADYNRWMNERIYDCAARLPAGECERERGAFFGSVLGTLNHVAVGDTLWMHRFAQAERAQHGEAGAWLAGHMQGFAQPEDLRTPLAPGLSSLSALSAYRQRLDDLISAWVQRLDASAMSAPLRYASMAGTPRSHALGEVLQHFFNHQTHHRGQASTLLFQAGLDVGDTDLVSRLPFLA